MWENKRDIKIVATDKRKNYLVSEPNYHTIKWFSECLLVIEMKTNKQTTTTTTTTKKQK